MAHPSSTVVVNTTIFNETFFPTELRNVANKAMVTLIPRDLTGKIVQERFDSSGMLSPMYLTGPGGVGKSSILFMTAAKVLERNAELLKIRQATSTASASALTTSRPVFLLYIANSGYLLSLKEEEAAVELCTMVSALDSAEFDEFSGVLSVLNDSTKSYLDRWNDLCLLLRTNSVVSLILVDQWNAIVETLPRHPEDTHPLLRFLPIAATLGRSQFVTAVSSSFLPLESKPGVFRDAEVQTAKRRIQPLSVEELKALRDIWAQRPPAASGPPTDLVPIDDSTVIALHEATGGIARLCEFFFLARREASNTTINSPQWRRMCSEYYVGRLGSVLRKLQDHDLQRRFFSDVASLFLRNRDLPNVDSTSASRWLSSGLLKEDASFRFLVPVNAFVRTAIDSVVLADQTLFLKGLYAHNSTKWRAIELFVFLQLRKENLVLTGTDLHGFTLEDIQFACPSSLQILEVDESFAADPIRYLAEHNGGQPFRSGTVLIPSWTTHPVADAVLYMDANIAQRSATLLVFIQVSVSKYIDHKSKIPHLQADFSQRGWKFTVLQSYQLAFGISTAIDAVKVEAGKLRSDVKYVYMTNNNELLKRRAINSGHEVFLMREDNMKKLNEQLWSDMTTL